MPRYFALIFLAALSAFSVLAAEYSWRDYGKDCADELGVELPPVDCTKGTLLKVHQNGKEVTDRIPECCDRPSLADTPFACSPGSRMLKIETKNAKGQNVVTMVACRRNAFHPIDSPIFENIAMYQHNTANNKVCWFQIRRPNGGMDARDVPPPFSRDPERIHKYKGVNPDTLYAPFNTVAQGEDSCIGCHDSQLYLRTPWAVYGNTKDRPPNDTDHGRLTHVGQPFAHWNKDDMQPKRIRIDTAAYNERFPIPKSGGPFAPANACTRCHSIGKSPLEYNNFGTCRDLVREFTKAPGTHFVMAAKACDAAKTFPQSHWMPPGHGNESFGTGKNGEANWRRHYSRALEAVTFCCANPDARINGKSICLDPEEGATSASDSSVHAPSDSMAPSGFGH